MKKYPQQIGQLEEKIENLKLDIEQRNQNLLPSNDDFVVMTLNNIFIQDKAEAGYKLIEQYQAITSPDPILIGEYRSFGLYVFFDSFHSEYKLQLKGHGYYQIDLRADKYGNIVRINNALDEMEKQLQKNKNALVDIKNQLSLAKKELYERKDIEALINFFKYSTIINDYERLELYKLGIHDCMIMLEMVNIL